MHLRAPGFRTSILIVLLATAALGHAQQPTPALAVDVQIDRIFRDHVYQAPASDRPAGCPMAPPTPWSNGLLEADRRSNRYERAQRREDGSGSFGASGAPRPRQPSEIDDYAWSADGRRLLIFTNTRKVWRQNTRGDYWVLDVATGALTQVGKAAPVVEPDVREVLSGRIASRLRPRQQHLRSASRERENGSADTRRIRIPPSAAPDGGVIVNGTSDWVYEEELNVRDGFRWSPDGRASPIGSSTRTASGSFH